VDEPAHFVDLQRFVAHDATAGFERDAPDRGLERRDLGGEALRRARVSRSERLSEAASASTIEQLGQTADTVSMSMSVSSGQPPLKAVGCGVMELGGAEPLPPLAAEATMIFVKQPSDVVHAGKPKCERYVARSDSAFGASYATTIPIVSFVWLCEPGAG
jgi:hypothetical protein